MGTYFLKEAVDPSERFNREGNGTRKLKNENGGKKKTGKENGLVSIIQGEKGKGGGRNKVKKARLVLVSRSGEFRTGRELGTGEN